MSPVVGFTLAILFFLGLPIGLILLVLGMFRRGPANLCACGYSRAGIPSHAPCPECGGPAPTDHDIPRVRWQINLGIALITVGSLSAVAFLLMLFALKTQ